MELKKQVNTKNYTVKKQHEKHDKRHKLAKEERKEDFDRFQSMSAQKLLRYIEEEYSRLDKEDTNMNKINNAIYSRICSIVKDFNKTEIMKKAEYVWAACGEKDTPEKIYQKMRETPYYNYPQALQVKYTHENNLRFVVLTADWKNSGKTESRKFLETIFNEERLNEIDFKRMKVDAYEVLKEFISHRSRAEKMVKIN